MEPLNDILTLNLPIGYLLTGLAVVGGIYFATKKLFALGLALIGRASLAFTSSFLMFVAGSTGLGFSTSELASRDTPEPPPESQTVVLTNQDLIQLAQNSDVDQAKLDYILTYAKDRDSAFLKSGQIDLMSLASIPNLGEKKVVEAPPQPALSTSSVGGLLGMSISMLIASAVVFFYRLS